MRFSLEGWPTRPVTTRPPSSATPPTRLILAVAGAALVLALALRFAGGYHAGFLTLNRLGTLLPPGFWAGVTLLGDTREALALLLLPAFRHPRILPAFLLAALPATLVVQGFKQLLSQARPAAVLDPGSFQQIGALLQAHSFPSGHSTTFGVLAALLLCLAQRRWQRGLILLGLALGPLSRVMVGAHWPVDILTGTAIGLLSGLGGYALAVRYALCRQAWSQWLAIALPLLAAVTVPFYDGGYPQGHRFATLVTLGVLALYLFQLFRAPPRSP